MNAKTQYILSHEDLIAICQTVGMHIETLETRNSDSLDFHEVSVSQLRRLITHAYQIGRISHAAGR